MKFDHLDELEKFKLIYYVDKEIENIDSSLYIYWRKKHICLGEILLSTWHTLESPGRRELQLKSCIDQIGLWPCLQEITLIGDLCGRAEPTPGSRQTYTVEESWVLAREWASKQHYMCCSYLLMVKITISHWLSLSCGSPLPPVIVTNIKPDGVFRLLSVISGL